MSSSIMLLFAITLSMNILFLDTTPSWVKDLDYIEIVLILLIMVSGIFTYTSVKDEAMTSQNLQALGFTRGEPFTFILDGKRLAVKKAWRYPDGRSFGIQSYPSNVIRIVYDVDMSERLKEKLDLESGYVKLLSNSDKFVFDVPGVIKVDDLIDIMEMLKDIQSG